MRSQTHQSYIPTKGNDPSWRAPSKSQENGAGGRSPTTPLKFSDNRAPTIGPMVYANKILLEAFKATPKPHTTEINHLLGISPQAITENIEHMHKECVLEWMEERTRLDERLALVSSTVTHNQRKAMLLTSLRSLQPLPHNVSTTPLNLVSRWTPLCLGGTSDQTSTYFFQRTGRNPTVPQSCA